MKKLLVYRELPAPLLDRLRERFDVSYFEAINADNQPAFALLCMANVVALPHIGSAAHETREAMARLAVDNIVAAFEGRPHNLVDSAT